MNGRDFRLAALRRFAVAISVFNLLGHAVLGFEQAWLHPFVGIATAYAVEMVLELVGARVDGRTARFAGGAVSLLDFLLPAHITGLAVTMLLYTNQRLAPLVFAVTVAIASKYIFRAQVGRARRHFLNPSNLGISVALLAFPSISIAMPYMFTANLAKVGDWVLPLIIVASGSFLNARFTRRVPLILAWLATFAAQALIRSVVFDTPPAAAWLPMTGLAFILFTFYMVTDPATTPAGTTGQILFGAAVGVVYSLLLTTHTVFALFFALSVVCLVRGVGLWALEFRRRKAKAFLPDSGVTGAESAASV